MATASKQSNASAPKKVDDFEMLLAFHEYWKVLKDQQRLEEEKQKREQLQLERQEKLRQDELESRKRERERKEKEKIEREREENRRQQEKEREERRTQQRSRSKSASRIPSHHSHPTHHNSTTHIVQPSSVNHHPLMVGGPQIFDGRHVMIVPLDHFMEAMVYHPRNYHGVPQQSPQSQSSPAFGAQPLLRPQQQQHQHQHQHHIPPNNNGAQQHVVHPEPTQATQDHSFEDPKVMAPQEEPPSSSDDEVLQPPSSGSDSDVGFHSDKPGVPSFEQFFNNFLHNRSQNSINEANSNSMKNSKQSSKTAKSGKSSKSSKPAKSLKTSKAAKKKHARSVPQNNSDRALPQLPPRQIKTNASAPNPPLYIPQAMLELRPEQPQVNHDYMDREFKNAIAFTSFQRHQDILRRRAEAGITEPEKFYRSDLALLATSNPGERIRQRLLEQKLKQQISNAARFQSFQAAKDQQKFGQARREFEPTQTRFNDITKVELDPGNMREVIEAGAKPRQAGSNRPSNKNVDKHDKMEKLMKEDMLQAIQMAMLEKERSRRK
jgi:hypothetical protein